ncbi:MAG: DUF6424 family protein [Acidimicrobiales bacterium]
MSSTEPAAPADNDANDANDAAVTALHHIRVGETLTENVDGHAARTDSPEFVHARATVQQIVATLDPNPYGPPPIQAHHGGSIWVHDGTRWRLVLNWAGIEWSAQFCCDPAKVEALRQNALAITSGFPNTIPQLKALGYKDVELLSTPISDAAGMARYVDCIWNSCVPIPEPRHTGAVTAAAPLAAGVHNYPEPMCAIPRVMHGDFVPFVTDPGTGTAAVVAPVAPRGSGDGRVRVLFAEKGHPLAAQAVAAHDAGAALVLGPNNPISQAAFVNQR